MARRLHFSPPVPPLPHPSYTPGFEESGVVVFPPIPRRSAAGDPAARAPRPSSRKERRQARRIERDAARSRRKRERAARREARRGRALPWLLLVLVLSAGALAGLFGWERYQMATEAQAAALGERDRASERAARLDAEVLQLTAELDRTREEAASAKAAAARADELAAKLETIARDGKGEVVREADGRLTLQLVDRVLFRSGEAELTERGQEVLTELGAALASAPDEQVWVQGHTDDVPIADDNELFASNWELSAARALGVVHFLETEAAVSPRRLAAVAFGEHRPVSRRKRKLNRRIEIVLFPADVKVVKD